MVSIGVIPGGFFGVAGLFMAFVAGVSALCKGRPAGIVLCIILAIVLLILAGIFLVPCLG